MFCRQRPTSTKLVVRLVALLLIGMGQFFLNFYPTYGTERSTLFLRLVESIMADIKKKFISWPKIVTVDAILIYLSVSRNYLDRVK